MKRDYCRGLYRNAYWKIIASTHNDLDVNQHIMGKKEVERKEEGELEKKGRSSKEGKKRDRWEMRGGRESKGRKCENRVAPGKGSKTKGLSTWLRGCALWLQDIWQPRGFQPTKVSSGAG